MTTTQERRWLLFFALSILMITSIPYLVGYHRQGEDWRFSGFVFGVEDGNSYIAKMLGGAEGNWLFRTPYTVEKQKGFLAFIPYLLLGKLTAPPAQHEQLVSLFHIFRWLAGLALVFSTYSFFEFFIQKVWLRRWCTAIAVAGGGLGWLALTGLRTLWGERLPLEFYSPESFGFLAVLGIPHLAMARALLLWGLRGYLIAGESSQQTRFFRIRNGLTWLLVGFFQPLAIVSGWAVIGAHLALTAAWHIWKRQTASTPAWSAWRRFLKEFGFILLFSAPWVIYNYLSFRLDPYLAAWATQNLILSPPFGDYLLAYGVLLPLAFAGVYRLWGQSFWTGSFLIGWLILFPWLAYAPYPLQRRLPEGIWTALTLMALLPFTSLGKPGWKISLFLSSLFLVTIIILTGSLAAVWQPQEPLYRTADEVAAFEFLSTRAEEGQVVLAAFDTSNALPAWAPLNTLVGHGPESAHLAEIMPRVQLFFQSNTPAVVREKLLEEFDVCYVFYGPAERNLGDWDPQSSAKLSRIYAHGSYEIYQTGCLPR